MFGQNMAYSDLFAGSLLHLAPTRRYPDTDRASDER
jgi:hypothetical protein